MLKRLLNNWSLKITALVIAIFLWSHVRGQVNPWEIAPFKVPLEVRLPKGIALGPTSRVPKTVTVTVRGPRLTLRTIKNASPTNPLTTADAPFPLSGGQVRAELDLSDVRPGMQTINIKAFTNLYDLDIVSVTPNEARIDVRNANAE